MYQYLPGGGAIQSICIAKEIRVISGAESSEQNDDKTNNLDDVILRQLYMKKRQKIIYIFSTTSVQGSNCSWWAGSREPGTAFPWPTSSSTSSSDNTLIRIQIAQSSTTLGARTTCSSSKVAEPVGGLILVKALYHFSLGLQFAWGWGRYRRGMACRWCWW